MVEYTAIYIAYWTWLYLSHRLVFMMFGHPWSAAQIKTQWSDSVMVKPCENNAAKRNTLQNDCKQVPLRLVYLPK